jgi:uncharacterized metal-binding protein YceD (DUF177 family)
LTGGGGRREKRLSVEAIETPISVELTIYRVESKYVLDGVFKGALRVVCDRCLGAIQAGDRRLNSTTFWFQ